MSLDNRNEIWIKNEKHVTSERKTQIRKNNEKTVTQRKENGQNKEETEKLSSTQRQRRRITQMYERKIPLKRSQHEKEIN